MLIGTGSGGILSSFKKRKKKGPMRFTGEAGTNKCANKQTGHESSIKP